MDNSLNRIPPQDINAEACLLGAILVQPKLFDDITLILSGKDFYKPAHQIIFDAMHTLRSEGKEIDSYPLINELTKEGFIDRIGGEGLIRQLIEDVPLLSNVEFYAKRVKTKAIQRNVLTAAQEIQDKCYQEIDEPQEFVSNAESLIFENSLQNDQSDSDVIHMRDMAGNVRETLKSGGLYYPTTFSTWDDMLGGIPGNSLILLAARPSMGKTALALNLLRRMAKHLNIGGAFFSLETGEYQLVKRMLSAEQKIKMGTSRKEEKQYSWQEVEEGLEKLASQPLLFNIASGLTPSKLESDIRRILRRYPETKLIFIDYVQLMRSEKAMENKQQEITYISQSLKAMCQRYPISIIALSQLNRAVETRPNKRPVLSDLRESGALEQDADIVVMMYRANRYKWDNLSEEEQQQIYEIGDPTEFIITKNKDGPIGIFKLLYFLETQRFDNLDVMEKDFTIYEPS